MYERVKTKTYTNTTQLARRVDLFGKVSGYR